MFGNAIFLIALHDDSYVPGVADGPGTFVLRRRIHRDRSPSCEYARPDDAPFHRLVQWTLNGKEVDGFGSAGVQVALELLSPSKVYLAVDNIPVTDLSGTARRSLSDVLDAFARVPELGLRIYLLFPPSDGHVPDAKVQKELYEYTQARGCIDGATASLAFEARTNWLSSKLFESAAKAAEKSLQRCVDACGALCFQQTRRPLFSTSTSAGMKLNSPRPQIVWSGDLVIAEHSCPGFELWNCQPGGGKVAKRGKLCSPRHKSATLTAIADSHVMLGALAACSAKFELRVGGTSGESLCNDSQPVFHKWAAVSVAWKNMHSSALLSIGDSSFLCNWRCVKIPMSSQCRWVCVAMEAPDMRKINTSILDVAGFRRFTLGLEGRTPIYSPDVFLAKLPTLELRQRGSDLAVLQLRSGRDVKIGERGVHQDVANAVKILSRRRASAPKKAADAYAKGTGPAARKSNSRKGDASTLERRTLSRWDAERALKRKSSVGGSIDAILTGESAPSKRVKHLVTQAAKQKSENGDPAAEALRNRRSLFLSGPQVGHPPRLNTLPRCRARSHVTPTRPMSSGPRSLPTRLVGGTPTETAADILASHRKSASRPSVLHASLCRDRMRDHVSLSCFLDGLKSFADYASAEEGSQLRPNGFSVGASADALRWQELVGAKSQGLAKALPNCDASANLALHGAHGVDQCVDAAGLFDSVECAILEIERRTFTAGVDHKSAFPTVCESTVAKHKLQNGVRLLRNLSVAPPTSTREIDARATGSRWRLSCDEVADALAAFVRRDEENWFTKSHKLWLPELVRTNCLEYHMPGHILMNPELQTSKDVAAILLNSRPDKAGPSEDGLFIVLAGMIESFRSGHSSLRAPN